MAPCVIQAAFLPAAAQTDDALGVARMSAACSLVVSAAVCTASLASLLFVLPREIAISGPTTRLDEGKKHFSELQLDTSAVLLQCSYNLVQL